MGDTEGSQRFIYSTTIDSTNVNQSHLPRDYFKLRINSNDSYSKATRPNNNAYDFTIDFPLSTAESLQFRIAQCNRYQVVRAVVPLRTTIGISDERVSVHSVVKRSTSLTTSLPTDMDTLHTFRINGETLTSNQFYQRYEPLRTLHIGVTCPSLNEVLPHESFNSVTIKKPQYLKRLNEDGRDIFHLQHLQASLLYDGDVHSSSPYFNMGNFSHYPHVNQKELLHSQARIIRPTFPANLSSLRVRIIPNDSLHTYDKHIVDYPIGHETDLTLIFYHEHDTLHYGE